MKISVIIPAYNEETYIAGAVQAVLRQDYPDFEVIVVDNAGTDRTAEIARGFPGIKVLHEDNKGTMWTCETGRRAASGGIIVRMDADCLPEPDWLSRGARFFDDSRVAMVSGPYDYYDAPAFLRTIALLIQKTLFFPLNAAMQALGVRRGISMGGNWFIRASALEQAGGFDTRIVFYGDDTDTPKRMSAVGKVVFSPRVIMRTSARRYRKEGIIRLQAKYLFYFFKTVFSGSK